MLSEGNLTYDVSFFTDEYNIPKTIYDSYRIASLDGSSRRGAANVVNIILWDISFQIISRGETDIHIRLNAILKVMDWRAYTDYGLHRTMSATAALQQNRGYDKVQQ